MHVTLLKHTVKAPTEYSYAYVLITNHYTVEDIIAEQKTGKKIVFFGSSPETYIDWCILREHGIECDYACDIHVNYPFLNCNVKMVPYYELLKNSQDYFFIVTIKEARLRNEIMQMLFFTGIHEFGVVCSNWSKDLLYKNKTYLQDAFFYSVNEVYQTEPLFNNFIAFENLRRTALEGAGFWDVCYLSIYSLFRKKNNFSYLEIGAGTGIMSFSLKKLLQDAMSIDWVSVPVTEKYWQENASKYFNHLKEKYDITEHFGYIEENNIPTLSGKKFDCIVLAQVMEHFIYNPVPTFIRIKNMILDNGYIYVAVPNEHKFYNVRSYREMPIPEQLTSKERALRTKINNYGHFHEYSKEEAIEVFTESGLEVVQHRWNNPINFFILRKK